MHEAEVASVRPRRAVPVARGDGLRFNIGVLERTPTWVCGTRCGVVDGLRAVLVGDVERDALLVQSPRDIEAAVLRGAVDGLPAAVVGDVERDAPWSIWASSQDIRPMISAHQRDELVEISHLARIESDASACVLLCDDVRQWHDGTWSPAPGAHAVRLLWRSC